MLTVVIKALTYNKKLPSYADPKRVCLDGHIATS
jgi:hypothetical protein